MVALNYARDVRIGDKPARAVALGSNFVWPALPERLFFRGQSLAYDFANKRYGTRLSDDTIDYTTNVSDLGILTRASTGTYWGPEGSLLEAAVDEARIQHDPVTGKALGLLVESEATNKLVRSDDLTSVLWSKYGVTIEKDAATAPDGNLAADKVVPTTATSEKYVLQNSDVTEGKAYTMSMFVQAAGYDLFQIAPSTGFPIGHCNFDLSTGTVIGGDIPDSTAAVIYPCGGGVYRVSLTAEGSRTTSVGRFTFGPVPSDNLTRLPSFAGDGTSGVYVWGVQFEEGPHPTSYIPTIDSPVTRAADNAAVDLSDVLNPDEGTLFFEFKAYMGGGRHHYVNLNNNFIFYESTTANRVEVYWGAGGAVILGSNVPSGYYRFKIALTYTGQQAQVAIRLDDDASVFSTETDFRIDNTLYLFNRPQGDRAADGIFKTVEYYPETVSEERLNQMVGGVS